MNDDDPMNMISGTTGLSGATDSNFVLRRSKRRENTATLYCTGRDISYRELSLEFDNESHVWNLLSDDYGDVEQSCSRLIFLLSALLREQPEICAPAKACLLYTSLLRTARNWIGRSLPPLRTPASIRLGPPADGIWWNC